MLTILFLPFIGVRFGLLSFVNKKALKRAAHFAPVKGNERIAYIVYQLATLVLAVMSLLLPWFTLPSLIKQALTKRVFINFPATRFTCPIS